MPILKNLWNGSKILGVGAISFIAGSVGWSAASGFIAGILDTFGIHLSGPMLISLGPVAGLLVALYVVSEVS